MTDTRKIALLLFAWAAAMPLLLLATVSLWHWLAAAHYYTAPVLFLGHFLFAVAGILFWVGRRGAGKWVAATAAVPGLLAAVVAMFMIGGFGRAGSAVPLVDGGRDFLYVLHGLYAAGHCFVVVIAFRGWRRLPQVSPA